MKEVFFNEDGTLRINDAVMEQPSFQRIMEDGVVTIEELQEQSNLILSLFREIEDTFTPEQKELVKKLLVEMNVLTTVLRHRETQVKL